MHITKGGSETCQVGSDSSNATHYACKPYWAKAHVVTGQVASL